jgi:hypothetical protein
MVSAWFEKHFKEETEKKPENVKNRRNRKLKQHCGETDIEWRIGFLTKSSILTSLHANHWENFQRR